MEYADRMEDLGLDNIPDKNTCQNHIVNKHIKRFVGRKGNRGYCDYCARETIVISLEDLMEYLMDAVHFFYNDPQDFMRYESREGGFVGDTYGPWDILEGKYHLDVKHHTLQEDIFNSLDHCQLYAFEYDYRHYMVETMLASWQDFKMTVKHRSRYFFGAVEDLDMDDAKLKPQEMLTALGKTLRSFKFIRGIETGTIIYRCRQHQVSDRSVNTHNGMTAPPMHLANQPNRMSPAGIPMFYGAFDSDTAIVETLDPLNNGLPLYSVARFKTTQTIQVVDLTTFPPMPDPFDAIGREHTFELQFLQDFVKDLTEPVVRKNHLEYVPTQVFTEYLRYPFSQKLGKGKSISGLVYNSSKNKNKALVIFINNKESSSILHYEGNVVSGKSIL